MRRHLLLGSVLGLGLPAILGCAGVEKQWDELIALWNAGDAEWNVEDADVEVDIDADTGSDPDAYIDTGIAALVWRGEFVTDRGAFTSANFGIGLFGLNEGDWVCEIRGDLAYEGEADPGCPDCLWSFDLGPIEESRALGPYCDAFFSDGELDGANDFQWGFANSYDYVSGAGVFTLEQVVFVNFLPSSGDPGGWDLFSYNYGGSVQVTGTADNLAFARPQVSASGNAVYYYYYR